MSNKATTVESPLARDVAPDRRRAKSVAACSIILLSIAAGLAQAQPAPQPALAFEGRWRDVASNVTLDISRCTAGWCGIAVEYDKCGGQKLELSVPAAVDVAAVGVYDLAGAGLKYPVQAGWRDGKLIVADNAKGNMAVARRSVSPVILTLTRIGAAVCGVKPAA